MRPRSAPLRGVGGEVPPPPSRGRTRDMAARATAGGRTGEKRAARRLAGRDGDGGGEREMRSDIQELEYLFTADAAGGGLLP